MTVYKQNKKRKDKVHGLFPVFSMLMKKLIKGKAHYLTMMICLFGLSTQSVSIESHVVESDPCPECDSYSSPVREDTPGRKSLKKHQDRESYAGYFKYPYLRSMAYDLKNKASKKRFDNLPPKFSAMSGQNGIGRPLNT